MQDRFIRPNEMVTQQDQFSQSEVGLTYPGNNTHIRLRDNGDIELVADDNVMITMNAARRCITFVADQIKFLTSEDNGLRWNKLAFNPKATQYEQPAFLPFLDTHATDLYQGADYYAPTGSVIAHPLISQDGKTDV